MLHEGSGFRQKMLFWLFAVLMIAGCASLGKDECLQADWQSIGYEDGARGFPGTRIGVHRKACAKHGVAPDLAAYESGRQKGLQEWCTPRNGYRIGLKGKQYNGVCPALLEDAFIEALGRGRAIFGYAQQVKKARQELKQMHVELEAMDADLQAMEAELVSEGATPRRRVHLLRKIRQLETDRDLFLNDIDDLEGQVADMQANLKQMRAETPYP